MIIPDTMRKCVAFVGLQMADDTFRFVGSVFWIGAGPDESGKSGPVYAVTARHVIDQIRSTGLQHVWFRVNLTDGESKWIRSEADEWFVHPSDQSLDVAIVATSVPSDWDHLVLPYSLCVDDELMKKHEVGLGDEVFVTGLFRLHHNARESGQGRRLWVTP